MSSYDRPGFGIILSLLAIGLVLNALRSFAELFKVFLQEGAAAEIGIGWLAWDVIALLWVLACLGTLLARRRLFIYLFGGLLLFNLASSALLFVVSGDELDLPVATAATIVQTVIAALWFAYLFMSEHLREVCCD